MRPGRRALAVCITPLPRAAGDGIGSVDLRGDTGDLVHIASPTEIRYYLLIPSRTPASPPIADRGLPFLGGSQSGIARRSLNVGSLRNQPAQAYVGDRLTRGAAPGQLDPVR